MREKESVLSNRWKIVLLILFLFAFRTLFGLSLNFFGGGDIDHDPLQTYLIGLKCYTTGTWPYFGPDKYTAEVHFQVPGALEGLVIGLPFYLLPIPEAPFLFLNLLSLSALALLAYYIVRRLPELSFPFVLTWMALLPWTLNRSTAVFNIAFLLFGSVLFFVGFFESLPKLSLKWIPPGLAFAMMGFGLFWDMQFHSSWVLLGPFILTAFVLRRLKEKNPWPNEVLGFLAGSAIPVACLIPTLIKYGFSNGSGMEEMAVLFNSNNFLSFFTILAQYLSLACYEIPRFLGPHSVDRFAFLKAAPWIFFPAWFLTLVGWSQPFVLLIYGAFQDPKRPLARWFYGLVMLTFFWTWFCFWFTSSGTAAHMYYLFLPLIAVYYFYLWSRLAGNPRWKIFGMVCLATSLWFQTGFIVEMLKKQSFLSDRGRIVKALEQKDYRLLAERRPWVIY